MAQHYPEQMRPAALTILDYPERFAQQALGHNSKAVHHAYSKHAEVTVPSLDDWEKDWQENPQRSVQPKLLPVDFRSSSAALRRARICRR
ncbi:MAG: hypothetical protein ABSD29_17840 [Verrucomicrobiota bacterium]|jgi:Zn/Cd-binding protein ZinT